MLWRLGVGSAMLTGAGLSARKECCESGERHTGEAVRGLVEIMSTSLNDGSLLEVDVATMLSVG
jgi:hypothetical protein